MKLALKRNLTLKPQHLFDVLPLVFWIFFISFLYRSTGDLWRSLYSISTLENAYFEVSVKDNHPTYKKVMEKPQTWVSLPDISKKAIGAIVVSEDGKFFWHHGYDIEQIQKVMAKKFLERKPHVRGASTITQQLIKNLYLTNEKSMSRKVQEFYFANYIEDKVTKNKILETYLNVIEYGKGIYGIENASQFYFKKSAKNLTAKEGAFLAMLLPNPKKYARSFHQKSLTPFASSIIESILYKMKMSGYITDQELQTNLTSPLSFEANSSIQNFELKNAMNAENQESTQDNNLNNNDNDDAE